MCLPSLAHVNPLYNERHKYGCDDKQFIDDIPLVLRFSLSVLHVDNRNEIYDVPQDVEAESVPMLRIKLRLVHIGYKRKQQ